MSFKSHKVILTGISLFVMSLSKCTPKLSESRWSELDVKINAKIGPLHNLLGTRTIPSDSAANQLGEILAEFLKNEPEFEEIEKEFFEQKESTSLEEARIMKRELRKKANKKDATPEDKANWLKSVKLYAFLLRVRKGKEEQSDIRKQENAYRKNFFKFAKDACNDTLGKERVKPGFTREQANAYYSAKYGNPVDIDLAKLDWFVPTRDRQGAQIVFRSILGRSFEIVSRDSPG